MPTGLPVALLSVNAEHREKAMTGKAQGYAMSLPATAFAYLNIRSMLELTAAGAVGAALVAWLAPVAWRPVAYIALTTLLVAGLLIEIPIVNRLQVRSASFEVMEHAVRIRRGILLRRDILIAATQLRNVTITDGPLLRRYGLVKVDFVTIAHFEPLGPVTAEQAARLRSHALASHLGAADVQE